MTVYRFSSIVLLSGLFFASCNKTVESKKDTASQPTIAKEKAVPTIQGTVDPITQAALDQDSTARIYYAKARALVEKGDDAPLEARVSALLEFANYMTFQAPVPPRIKYRPALKAYRDALALDPTNETALANKKTIEDIYTGMGMPIPQD